MSEGVREPRAHSSASRAAILATVGTVAGFGTTLVQQLFYARSLGVGPDTDALAAAIAWAVTICGFAGSTFASVVIPIYVRTIWTDGESATHQFRTATAGAIGVGLVAALSTWAFADRLGAALLPGASPPVQAQVDGLLRLTAPLFVLWMAVACATAMCNARARYLVAAASTVLPSLPVILVLALPGATVERTLIAYSIGAGIQLVALLAATRAWWSDLLPLPSLTGALVLRARVIPVVAAFLSLSATGPVSRAIASLGGTGDVTVFDYATRLSLGMEQLLLSGVLAVTLTTWSVDAAGRGRGQMNVDDVLRFSVGLVIAAAAAVVLLGTELVSVLFSGGRFSSADAAAVGHAMAWIAPGMAARMLLMLAFRALLARGSRWQLLTPGLVGVVVLVPIAMIGQSQIGLTGVCVAYSLAWGLAAAATLFVSESVATLRILLREAIRALTTVGVAAGVSYAVMALAGPGGMGRFVAGSLALASATILTGWFLRLSVVRLTVDRLLGFSSLRFPRQYL